MPDNWINQRKLTSEDAIYDLDGNKIHDLIDTESKANYELDEEKYPLLWVKLSTVSNTPVNVTLPDAETRSIYSYNGSWYYSTRYGSSIHILDSEGGVIGEISCPDVGPLESIYGIVIDGDHVYYSYNNGSGTDANEATLSKRSISTGNLVTSISLGVYSPPYMSSDGTSLYVTYRENSSYYTYNLSLVFLSEELSSVDLSTYSYVLKDPYNDGYSVSNDNEVLLYINNSSVKTIKDFGAPQGVLLSCFSGVNLYLGSSDDDRIYRYSEVPVKSIPPLTRPTGSPNPYKIVADATS